MHIELHGPETVDLRASLCAKISCLTCRRIRPRCDRDGNRVFARGNNRRPLSKDTKRKLVEARQISQTLIVEGLEG